MINNSIRDALVRLVAVPAMLGLPPFMIAPQAAADHISLSDGRVLEGEVISEEDGKIVFRHEVAGIWTNSTFRRIDVEMIDRVDGDQSDRGAAAPVALAPANRAPDLNGAVALVKLHGHVGGIHNDSVLNTFDADALIACFKQAQEAKATALVLDIHSPGGMVSEMEAICRAILDWQGRLRIVAYPRDAFSAAAVITLCCREIVVRPDSRIGAAVIVRGNASGTIDAVDAKTASPHHALQKQFMTQCGRPYELLQAMTIQETQLWWSELDGFRIDDPPKDGEWTKVDGSTTVLTMTADDAVRWEVALGRSGNVRSLMRTINVDDSAAVVDITDIITERNRRLDRELAGFIKDIDQYFSSLGQMVTSMNKLKEAYEDRDRTAASRHKGDVSQCLSKIQSAGRSLRKADRSILARRVELPDVLLAQIEEDAVLLGRITRLIKQDTVNDFNDAVGRLNTVLDAWKKILKQEQ